MKLQQLQEEMEQTIEDKAERFKVMEGTIGDILSSTQVRLILHISTRIRAREKNSGLC